MTHFPAPGIIRDYQTQAYCGASFDTRSKTDSMSVWPPTVDCPACRKHEQWAMAVKALRITVTN